MISFTFGLTIFREGENPSEANWRTDAKDFNKAISNLEKFRKSHFKNEVMFRIRWFEIS